MNLLVREGRRNLRYKADKTSFLSIFETRSGFPEGMLGFSYTVWRKAAPCGGNPPSGTRGARSKLRHLDGTETDTAEWSHRNAVAQLCAIYAELY
jgi:predicted component of type VI protein secretion system